MKGGTPLPQVHSITPRSCMDGQSSTGVDISSHDAWHIIIGGGGASPIKTFHAWPSPTSLGASQHWVLSKIASFLFVSGDFPHLPNTWDEVPLSPMPAIYADTRESDKSWNHVKGASEFKSCNKSEWFWFFTAMVKCCSILLSLTKQVGEVTYNQSFHSRFAYGSS